MRGRSRERRCAHRLRLAPTWRPSSGPPRPRARPDFATRRRHPQLGRGAPAPAGWVGTSRRKRRGAADASRRRRRQTGRRSDPQRVRARIGLVRRGASIEIDRSASRPPTTRRQRLRRRAHARPTREGLRPSIRPSNRPPKWPRRRWSRSFSRRNPRRLQLLPLCGRRRPRQTRRVRPPRAPRSTSATSRCGPYRLRRRPRRRADPQPPRQGRWRAATPGAPDRAAGDRDGLEHARSLRHHRRPDRRGGQATKNSAVPSASNIKIYCDSPDHRPHQPTATAT